MHRNTSLHDLAKLLPDSCALTDAVTGKTILVKFGETGYWPAPHVDVDDFNRAKGVTEAQKEAMEIGSMCGFDVPGADPRNWEG